MLSLPDELLPRILADPACVRGVACACTELSRRVDRRTFARVGTVVSSDYYIVEYKFRPMHLLPRRPPAVLIINDIAGMSDKFLQTQVITHFAEADFGSWEQLLPAPRGYLKFVFARSYSGKGLYGNNKWRKRTYLGCASLERLGGLCDALVLGSDCIYDRERVFAGKTNTISIIAKMVAQGCAVYLRE
jgi:hypothetical protein